jgi:hypothetical protein
MDPPSMRVKNRRPLVFICRVRRQNYLRPACGLLLTIILDM